MCEANDVGSYKDSVVSFLDSVNHVRFAVSVLVIFCMIVGLFYFYVLQRMHQKPLFVNVIFSLLSLCCILTIAAYSLWYKINHGIPDATQAISYRIIRSTNSSVGSICHWIFASKYFELALSLPIFLGFVDGK